MDKILVAEWKTRGKDFFELYEHEGNSFTYDGYQCGGCMGVTTISDAISKIEKFISYSHMKSWRRVK